jgi:hypothetical protein
MRYIFAVIVAALITVNPALAESCSADCPGGGSVSCSTPAGATNTSCTAGSGSCTAKWTEDCGLNCTQTVERTKTCGGGGGRDPENPE